METYKFGFLILHYNVPDETIACIKSIQDYVTGEYEIIVVDNASPDGSGKLLYERFHKGNCTVLCLEENLGFSGGNNVGFLYAKETLHCDFICMMNNDTKILQDNFVDLVLKEYALSHFAVVGPEIELADGSICQYPKHILKLDEIEGDRQRVKKLLMKNKWFIESAHLFLYKYIGKFIRWNQIKHRYREIPTPDTRMEAVRLHGCFMIFSPIYVQAFDGLDHRTFMYGEEDILFVRLIRNHMLSVYQPAIKVFHHEEASTSAQMGKDYKKRRFIYEKHLGTLTMLETLYREDLDSLKDYI